MSFEEKTDGEFRDEFVGILTKGVKNNTYKFALARFMLEYSQRNNDPMVRYSMIAEYFFKYYWMQECKFKLRQGPENQRPEIITIIRDEFPEQVYPQTFKRLKKEKPDQVSRCIEKITKKCFDDVIPRFQKISGEKRTFFHYFAKEYGDSADNKRIDPRGGILLNREAINFFRGHHACLLKAVTLEWLRFLEKRNFGTPNLVKKLEGIPGLRNQRVFVDRLWPLTEGCFYCEDTLRRGANTHVDHFIPYDYVGDTAMWNLVLACQGCNCKKSDRLPPQRYLGKLHERNSLHPDEIDYTRGLSKAPHGQNDLRWHYHNAKRHGYPVLSDFPGEAA